MVFLFVTDHVIGGRAKATIHFVAEEFARRGFQVSALTTGVSALSRLKGDIRWRYLRDQGAKYEWKGVGCRIAPSLLHTQNFHVNAINLTIGPLASRESRWRWRSALNKFPAEPDFVIVESGYSVEAFGDLKKRFPRAHFTYWVSDDPVTLRMHPLVIDADREAAEHADIVVLAADKMERRYSRGVVLPRGIDIDAFLAPRENPYSTETNVVSVGTMLFDRNLVEAAARRLPDFNFHVIGPAGGSSCPKNVKYYGLVEFDQTVAYIQHADVGLAPYFKTQGAEYLSGSSLKLNQYALCRKPIVVPKFACRDEDGYFAYDEESVDSLALALKVALQGPGARLNPLRCTSWSEVCDKFLQLAK